MNSGERGEPPWGFCELNCSSSSSELTANYPYLSAALDGWKHPTTCRCDARERGLLCDCMRITDITAAVAGVLCALCSAPFLHMY